MRVGTDSNPRAIRTCPFAPQCEDAAEYFKDSPALAPIVDALRSEKGSVVGQLVGREGPRAPQLLGPGASAATR